MHGTRITMDSNTHRHLTRKKSLMKYTWRTLSIWTLILIGLLVYDLIGLRKVTNEFVTQEARTQIKWDISFRSWAASHGGLYVPVTRDTKPNVYLSQIPERDIATPSGKKLTLMNPAWAMRQLHELFVESFDIAGHLTSLKPISPENGPDNWERPAGRV